MPLLRLLWLECSEFCICSEYTSCLFAFYPLSMFLSKMQLSFLFKYGIIKAIIEEVIPMTDETKNIEFLKNELVDNLDLSVWAWHCLDRAGIKSIYDLLKYDGPSLMGIYMMNEEYVDEIREKLKKEYGLVLKDEDPENNEVKKAATLLDEQYSKEALFFTDAMLKCHQVIDKVTELSDDFGIHALILLNKLPEFTEKAIENKVCGEQEILNYVIDQLQGYIIELADAGKTF